MNPKYNRDLEALASAIGKWLTEHPSAHVQIEFGDPTVALVGALPLGLQYWKINDAARSLIQAVDASTNHQCTMMQFRIAWAQLAS